MPSTRSFVNASKDTLAAQWGMSSCYAASRGPPNLKKWHLHVGEWIRWLNQRSGWEPWGFSNGGTHLRAQIFHANLYGQTWVICPKKIVHEVWGPRTPGCNRGKMKVYFRIPGCLERNVSFMSSWRWPQGMINCQKNLRCVYIILCMYIYIHMWVNYMNLISHTNL